MRLAYKHARKLRKLEETINNLDIIGQTAMMLGDAYSLTGDLKAAKHEYNKARDAMNHARQLTGEQSAMLAEAVAARRLRKVR